ncbi:MAG: hypothetical protein MMC33_010380 [Icmadophila ericetorum]|nr:hypothetical protein [Icmadophila ericetorum]
METPPPKRRKTSTDGLTPGGLMNHEEPPVNYDGTPTTPSRPLFMSPTKASLAKFNPNLLPRIKSPVGEVVRSRSANRTSFARNRAATKSDDVVEESLVADAEEGRRKSLLIDSFIRGARKSPGPSTSSIGGGLSEPPRRRSRTPRKSSPIKATEPTGSGALSVQEHALNPVKEAENDIHSRVDQQFLDGAEAAASKPEVNATPIRAERRAAGRLQEEEPELPPTPTDLGLEPPPDPPKGLFSSSPSRRRAMKRKTAGVRSSALKPRNSSPNRRAEDTFIQEAGDSSIPIENSHATEEAIPDPESIKKKDKEKQLQTQVKGLQDDIEILRAELGRASDSNTTSRSREEVDKLISVLTSNNPSHKPIPPPSKPPLLSRRLAAFLPFAPPRSPTPPPSVADTTPPPPQVTPVDDSNPLAKMFSVFTVNSVDTLVPSSTPSGPLLRSQEITMTSPNDLITAQLKLLVNTRTGTVECLELTNLTAFAEAELGPWIREQALAGDINSIGWALGRYWEVASIRARCWKACEEEFPELLSFAKGHSSSSDPAGNRKPPAAAKPTKGGRGKPAPSPAANEDNAANNFNASSSHTSLPLSPTDLAIHLPRISLTFSSPSSSPGVSLHIIWHLSFDWLGDVESHVSARASFPPAWKTVDERGSLGKVGECFDSLVKKKGVLRAIKGVVGVLFVDAEGET